jgi:uncharacterized membrane protein YebE (DUF533 family)
METVNSNVAMPSAQAGSFRLATLVPPVMVAWADGEMDASERHEILRIAAKRGIVEGTEAHRKLLGWLEREPAPAVYEAATRTIEQALRERPRYEAATLAHDLHERTTGVALVSRSYWGLGPRVSSGEQQVVEMLEQHIKPFTYPILKS